MKLDPRKFIPSMSSMSRSPLHKALGASLRFTSSLAQAFTAQYLGSTAKHSGLVNIHMNARKKMINAKYLRYFSSSHAERPRSSLSEAIDFIRKKQALARDSGKTDSPKDEVKARNKKIFDDFMASRSDDENEAYESDIAESASEPGEINFDSLTESLVSGLRGGSSVPSSSSFSSSLDKLPEADKIVKVKDAVGPATEGELRYLELQKKLKHKREQRSKLIPELEKKVRYRRQRAPTSEVGEGSGSGAVAGDGDGKSFFDKKMKINMTDAGFGISYDDEKISPRQSRLGFGNVMDKSHDVPKSMTIDKMRRLTSASIKEAKRQMRIKTKVEGTTTFEINKIYKETEEDDKLVKYHLAKVAKIAEDEVKAPFGYTASGRIRKKSLKEKSFEKNVAKV